MGIDKEIELLIQWMEKYPKAEVSRKIPEEVLREYCTTEEEYIAFTEEYEKMKKYYVHIKEQKKHKKLTEEQVSKCKEGNVRGVFGYSTEIEELAKKYGQTAENIAYIINNYGTVHNFKELYIRGQLDKNGSLIASSMIRTIIDIDLNPNSKKYDDLICSALGLRGHGGSLRLYSSEKLKEFLETLPPRDKKIIERRYGLVDSDLPRTYESIGKELGVTRELIRQRDAKILGRLRHPLNKIIYSFTRSDMITDEEGKLIDELEENLYSSDIIFSNNPYQISQADDKSSDILRALELIKNMDEITKKRRAETGYTDAYLKTVRIEDLGLSVRSFNCLSRANKWTLSDISQLSIEELMIIRNMGRKSVEEIIKILREYGIYLRREKDLEDSSETLSVYEETDSANSSKDIVSEGKSTEDNYKNSEENTDAYLKTVRIEELGLSVRSFNCLSRANKWTLSDISQLSIEELMRIRNMGRKSVEEIIEKLAEKYGITLRSEKDLEDSSKTVSVHEGTDSANSSKDIVTEGKSTEDEFLGEVVSYASRRVEVRERNEQAKKLEKAYIEILPKEERTVGED